MFFAISTVSASLFFIFCFYFSTSFDSGVSSLKVTRMGAFIGSRALSFGSAESFLTELFFLQHLSHFSFRFKRFRNTKRRTPAMTKRTRRMITKITAPFVLLPSSSSVVVEFSAAAAAAAAASAFFLYSSAMASCSRRSASSYAAISRSSSYSSSHGLRHALSYFTRPKTVNVENGPFDSS